MPETNTVNISNGSVIVESTVVTKKEFSEVKTELDSKISDIEYDVMNNELQLRKDMTKMAETDLRHYKLLVQQDKEITQLQKQLKYHRYILLLLSISILMMWIFIIFR